MSRTPAPVIAGASGTLHAWLGLPGKHGHPPAASLLSGVMRMQSKDFCWKTSHLTSECCFSGTQMLSTGLKSAANLGFSTRTSFNKFHQVLHQVASSSDAEDPTLPSLPSASQLPTNLGLTGGAGRCPRAPEELELCWVVDNTSSAALEKQAFTTESGW